MTAKAKENMKYKMEEKQDGCPGGTMRSQRGECIMTMMPIPRNSCSYLGHQSEVILVEGMKERRMLSNPTR